MIMRVAPVAAFGVAFTVGKYGLGSLLSLGQLMGCMYLTCIGFVFIVLGVVARISGFSQWKFLRYIRTRFSRYWAPVRRDRWCRR
jgi:aerobic C4-dicarboxylate transport protein